jgi:predicted nicotinamide N-methyase
MDGVQNARHIAHQPMMKEGRPIVSVATGSGANPRSNDL